MTEAEPGVAGRGDGHPDPRPSGTLPSLLRPLQGAAGEGPFLDAPDVPPLTRNQGWRWILFALAGFVLGQVAAVLFGVAAGAIDGKTSAQMTAIASSAQPPEWYVVSTLAGIWFGYIGLPWLASRTAGTGRFLRDLGLRFAPIDLVLGIVIGLVSQFVIGALYAPFQHAIHNYNAPTQKLIGASHGGGGVLIIVLASVLFAPFAEELCFRGLLFKGLARLCVPEGAGARTRQRRVGVAAAVVLDGLLFGLAHGEWVQLAGLAIFGMVLAAVSYRTGRLGMNMVAHATFNMTAVISYFHWIH